MRVLRQATGWGELLTCAVSAEVIGPRICIRSANGDGEACSALAFGTLPVLQVSHTAGPGFPNAPNLRTCLSLPSQCAA
jgi:hypothetical protein